MTPPTNTPQPNEHRANPPQKHPEKTALSLLMLVGGFLLLIMIIGWLIVANR